MRVDALPPFRTDPRIGCRDADPDILVPDGYSLAHLAAARRICGGCPRDLRVLCLEWALGNELVHGIYAGTTPAERRTIVAARIPVEKVVSPPPLKVRNRSPVCGRTYRGGHGPEAVFAAAKRVLAGEDLWAVVIDSGVSKTVIQRAMRVQRVAPELADRVAAGVMSMVEAYDRLRDHVSV